MAYNEWCQYANNLYLDRNVAFTHQHAVYKNSGAGCFAISDRATESAFIPEDINRTNAIAEYRMNLIILSVGVLCVCAISAGPTGSKRVEGAHKERGILHGHKPVVKDVSSHIIGPNEENDGCKRQYPLTPNKVQQVPLAFNQYGISPALTAPPPGYVDVSIFSERRRIDRDMRVILRFDQYKGPLRENHSMPTISR